MIFSDLINQREITSYNFRRHTEFRVPLTRTRYHGSKSVLYLGPKIGDIHQTLFKEADSLNNFKRVIKKWLLQVCPCRLCKNYIFGVRSFRVYHTMKSVSFLIIDFLIYLFQWFSCFSLFPPFFMAYLETRYFIFTETDKGLLRHPGCLIRLWFIGILAD